MGRLADPRRQPRPAPRRAGLPLHLFIGCGGFLYPKLMNYYYRLFSGRIIFDSNVILIRFYDPKYTSEVYFNWLSCIISTR